MADGVENVTSAPQSTYIPPVSAPATSALNNASLAVNSFKDKQSYLRENKFWVGKSPRQDVVENLYSLHTSGNITADHWNMYGNAAKPWEEQSPKIGALGTVSVNSDEKAPAEQLTHETPADTVSERSAPAVTKPQDGKVKELREKGYWIGNNPRQDLINGLYEVVSAGSLTAAQWNKMGDSSRSWDRQSSQLRAAAESGRPQISHEDTAEDEVVEPAARTSGEKTVQDPVSVPVNEAKEQVPAGAEVEPPHYEPHTPEDPIPEPPRSYAHLIPSGSVAQKDEAVYSGNVVEHTVKEGDILSRLAVRYHTSVEEILSDNPEIIDDPDRLPVGTVLKVHPGLDPMVIPTMFARATKAMNDFMGRKTLHTVVRDENLSRIAQMYGISVPRILWDNRDALSGSGNKLQPGQQLLIRTSELPEEEISQMREYYNEVLRTEKLAGMLKNDTSPVSGIRKGVIQYYGTENPPRAIEERVLNEFTSESLARTITGASFAKAPSGLKGGLYQLDLIKKIRENPDLAGRPLIEMHFDMEGGEQLRIFYRDNKQLKVWTAKDGVQDASRGYLFTNPPDTYLVEFGATPTFARGIISSTPEEISAFQEHFNSQLSELKQGMEALGIVNPVFIPGHGGTSEDSYMVTSKGNNTGDEMLIEGALRDSWNLHAKLADSSS